MLLTLSALPGFAASALPVVAEIEPNNEPHQGLLFQAPAILSGAMPKPNDQDAYRWRISDAQAQQDWTLTLTGMPEALTGVSIIRVTADETGTAVTKKETLLTFGIRDGSRPVRHQNLLLPPGELVVGVFGAGQAQGGFAPPRPDATALDTTNNQAEETEEDPLTPAYRVAITAGSGLTVRTFKPHPDRAQALAMRMGSTLAEIVAGETWYRFEVPDANVPQRYTLKAGIDLSRALQIVLLDSAGKEVTRGSSDRFGKAALQNLVLAPGNYFVKAKDTAGDEHEAVRRVRIVSVGEVADGEEREPNANWAKANTVDFNQPLSGQVESKGEADWYRFELATSAAATPWDLVLESETLTKVQVCLLDENGSSRQCRSGPPPLVLSGLVLNPGIHGALVDRSTKPGTYQLTLRKAAPLPRRSEQEPNDKPGDASLFGKSRIIKGTLSRQDTDQVLLITTETPQLWRLQAIGEGLKDLRYWPQHGEAGQSVRASSNSRRLRLDNLFLLPGQHQFSLTAARDTKYVLRALPLGPPNLAVEREPNNNRNTAHGLTLNKKAVALLTERSDADWYRFHLAAAQWVALQLRPAPDGAYRTTLYADAGQIKQFVLPQGKALEELLWLEPGDYYFSVGASKTSDAEYEVQVDQIDAPPRQSDLEPNDIANTASPWPLQGRFRGNLGVSRAGADWYVIPPRSEPLTLVLPALKTPRIQVVDEQRRELSKPVTDPQGVRSVTLPAESTSYLYLSGNGAYDFQLLPAGALAEPEPDSLPVKIDFSSSSPAVAAYSDWQQSVSTELTLSNTSSELMAVRLTGSTTDQRWQLELPRTPLALKPGERIKVPLALTIAPDAWPDLPVRLRVTATDEQARTAWAAQAITAERTALPLNPKVHQPVPAALRGHINVAAAYLGAQWQSDPKQYQWLNDGQLMLGYYFESKRDGPTGPAVDVPVIDLVGDVPVQVTGFSLHPFGLQGTGSARRNARDFEIALSNDGQQFETVMKGTLSGHTQAQYFPLSEPTSAKFARLKLLTSADRYAIALGEWKVLADPGTVPSVAKANIADPELGGHITWMSPPQPNYGYLKPLLTPDDKSSSNRQQTGHDAAWVVGFHHNRMARVSHLSWRNSESPSGAPIRATEILVAQESPLGPWTSVGQWTLEGTGEQEFRLPKPVWARFIKFDVEDAATGITMAQPAQIKVFEAPDAYGSILGEWGYDNPRGPFELSHPATALQPALGRPSNDVRERAKALAQESPEQGVVRLADYDNWYRVQVPEGHNHLALELTAAAGLRAEAEAFDRNGEKLTLETIATEPNRLHLEAQATPGEYWVKVSEPPRSVIFTWDTSGSTASVRPIIRQAVMNYVKDVRPGLDEARMLPFGGGFLSNRWIDQPYLLQSVLNDYNGAGNSSAAETALLQASRALRERPGQKVIVHITDAATSSNRELWPMFAQTKPQIIALGVSSHGAFGPNPTRERDLMQDWAMVGDGYYEYIDSVGAMERAFDRASSKIRQPAPHRIVYRSRFEPDPEPGFLQVVYAKEDEKADIKLSQRTIEVVLDASGSMLQQMEGKRRYQIAREVLSELIDSQLPDSANFALRVFGHKEPGACQTDLVMGPAQLDRAAVQAQLQQITPKNLAKTPIAQSLKAAASDLASVTGEKLVLLITDGEETCDGDAEAAIQTLRDAGLDTRLNIVGFAVDDADLAATFERWAQLGGGEYFGADSAKALASGVVALAAETFEVFDAKEQLIAKGVRDSERIELPPGKYTVRLKGSEPVETDVVSNQTASVLVSR